MLLDEALDWVVRLKTGAPTRADLEELQRWRAQSPAHEEAYKAAARIFRNAGMAAQELADRPVAIDPALAAQRSRPAILARRALLDRKSVV